MASSSSAAALISVFLLLLTIQIHARDSQFFSKVTNKQIDGTTVETPNKEQEPQSLTKGGASTEQQTEQYLEQNQPEFVPQGQNGYGLYGHETGLFSPSTEKTETKSGVQAETPGTYSSEKCYNNEKNDEAQTQQFGSHGDTYYVNNNVVTNNGEKYYSNNKNGVEANPDDFNFDDNFDNTEFDESNNNRETYYTTDSKNNNNVYSNQRYVQPQNSYNKNGETETETYYNTNTKKNSNNQFGNSLAQTESTTTDDFNNQINSYGANNRGNVKRRGMSDARFIENGKYYYDLENEQNHGSLYQNNYNTNKYNTKVKNYDSFSQSSAAAQQLPQQHSDTGAGAGAGPAGGAAAAGGGGGAAAAEPAAAGGGGGGGAAAAEPAAPQNQYDP